MGVRKEKLKVIIPLLALSFILRIINLDQSLWLDEAINVMAVKDNDLINLLTHYTQADFHPPGYFLLLWVWTKVFGYSEVAVRLPSVIFGVGTVYVAYLIGKKLQGEKLGLMVALLLALNPMHLYYSQEARMYSLAAMAVSLNFYFFLRLIRQEKNSQLGFIFSLLLVLSSDYLTYLIFPAQLIFLLWTKQKTALMNWLKLTLLGLVAWSWWIPYFLHQLNTGLIGASQVPGWKEVVGSFGIKPLILTYIKFIIGRISYPDNLIYGMLFLPAGLLFGFLIARALFKTDRKSLRLILSWLLIPLILAWVISIFVPVYSYFRLLFLLVPFLLLTSWGLISLSKKLTRVSLLVVALTSFLCSGIYLFMPTFQREDWKGVVSFISQQAQPQLVLLESNGSFSPFDYYATNKLTTTKVISTVPALKNFPAKSINDVADLENFTASQKQLFLLQYLVDIADPQKLVQQKLEKLDYQQAKIYNFNGVGFVYLYQK